MIETVKRYFLTGFNSGKRKRLKKKVGRLLVRTGLLPNSFIPTFNKKCTRKLDFNQNSKVNFINFGYLFIYLGPLVDAETFGIGGKM